MPVQIAVVIPRHQVMRQLVDAAREVHARIRAPGLLAPTHGIERDGGIETEREGLGKILAVAQSQVNGARAGLQNDVHGAFQVEWQAKRAGIVVARPGGHHRESRSSLRHDRHEGVYHQMHEPVTAHGDDGPPIGGALYERARLVGRAQESGVHFDAGKKRGCPPAGNRRLELADGPACCLRTRAIAGGRIGHDQDRCGHVVHRLLPVYLMLRPSS